MLIVTISLPLQRYQCGALAPRDLLPVTVYTLRPSFAIFLRFLARRRYARRDPAAEGANGWSLPRAVRFSILRTTIAAL